MKSPFVMGEGCVMEDARISARLVLFGYVCRKDLHAFQSFKQFIMYQNPTFNKRKPSNRLKKVISRYDTTKTQWILIDQFP